MDMGKSLVEIAQELKNNSGKAQLIYAFNGVGKTRLSRAFKEIIAQKHEYNLNENEQEETRAKIIYYNAFTEDLFYWDNDLKGDGTCKLMIRPNRFTDWILGEEGKENAITALFRHYIDNKLTPNFNTKYNEVVFSLDSGDENSIENIKISRGEESCFIWCIFYSLLEEVVEVLNASEEDRTTNQFDDLEYVFIDDPVSSLDENHLIELAVNIAELIKNSPKSLKYIITTHNTFFYNVLYSELGLKNGGYLLHRNEDGTFDIESRNGASNTYFSYHLFLKQNIETAIANQTIQKYHFTLLRNLYEKTANFLGYENWTDLLPDNRHVYYRRIINFTSHSKLSYDMVAEPTDKEKNIIEFLLNHLVNTFQFYRKEEQQ